MYEEQLSFMEGNILKFQGIFDEGNDLSSAE